jgi:hypothetical protein
MDRFVLYFSLRKKSINIALAQKIGDGVIPLTRFYSWPMESAWEKMQCYLGGKNWISKTENNDLLNSFNQVLNYWGKGDSTVIKKLRSLKENFPLSFYPNFRFWGRRKKDERKLVKRVNRAGRIKRINKSIKHVLIDKIPK